MGASCISSVVLLAFATLASSCTSAASTASAPTQFAAPVPGSLGIGLIDDRGVMVSELFATPNKVWWALPEAFDSLGVPLTLIDHPKKTLANEGFKARQKLGLRRLSTYFECGTTQVGPNADSYEMYITVITQLDSLGPAQTRMTTLVSGAAKPMLFAQEYSRCTSKGTLEKEILAVVNAHLKK